VGAEEELEKQSEMDSDEETNGRNAAYRRIVRQRCRIG